MYPDQKELILLAAEIRQDHPHLPLSAALEEAALLWHKLDLDPDSRYRAKKVVMFTPLHEESHDTSIVS